MSTTAALYTSESLKAANAQPYSNMEGILDPVLLQALKDMKFDFMTPVQSKVLSGLPSLKSDCLCHSKTGSGKTIAYLLPAIQNALMQSPSQGQVAVLVLSPTRELALQIAAEASRLVSKMRKPFEVHTAFGGTAKASNLKNFVRGDPKILVATPGRLNDYLGDEDVRARFRGLMTLVLDEADRMLDAGFLPDILKILGALPPKSGKTGKWQGMCFSATIPPKMEQVLSHVLSKDHISISTIDASEPPTLAKVPQLSVIIPSIANTLTALYSIIGEEIQANEQESKIIVFGTTANLVALYAQVFEGQTNLRVFELQSRMSQPARLKATDAFKVATNGILFATDVVGRGMDFPNVSLVLQVGLPTDADAYTHRVGRTARAGKDGRAVILLTQIESFFLSVNRQFPINPHPASDNILNDVNAIDKISRALRGVDPKSKQKAYSAYLGFMKGFVNKLRINTAELVQMANDFAIAGMQCDEVPEMERKTIGKMGLKGVPGIRYAKPLQEGQDVVKRKLSGIDMPTGDEASSRRLRHQGVPDSTSTLRNEAWEDDPVPGQRPSDRGGSKMRGGRDSGRGASSMRGRGRGGGSRSSNVPWSERREGSNFIVGTRHNGGRSHAN